MRAWSALLLAAFGLPGCFGLAIGTIVDDVGNAVTYPVHEYVFLGAYKYGNNPNEKWKDLEDDHGRDYGEELIGLAVSGGGSRSACFLEAVLDEMRRVPPPGAATVGPDGRSLLDEIDYISSVSGGSLSSAYYVLHRPRGHDPKELDAFFAKYHEAMRLNFENRSLGRMFLMFRWIPMLLTYYDRTHLMAGTWDANLFQDRTFADIPPPGDGIPSLLMNACSYANGNSFVLSRIPSRRLRESIVFRDLPLLVLNKGSTTPEHRPFFTSGFDVIDCDISNYPVSYGVVASASVPGLLGPVMLKDGRVEGRMESLGDGGIYDNYGLETIVQMFTTILQERPGLKARIIVVDGSGYFQSYREFARPALGEYVDRTPSISWNRAAGYASILFQVLRRTCLVDEPDGNGGTVKRARIARQEDSPYRNLEFQVLSLYHARTGAELEEDAVKGSTIRAILTAKPLTDAVADYNTRVRGIGTRLKIGAEDADIVESQARQAVEDVLGPPKPPSR